MQCSAEQMMRELDAQFSHIWMVRTFLKHSEEAEEDDELCDVHRQLYDVMHSLGPALAAGDAERYLKQAGKKLSKLRAARDLFAEIQPEISQHMNFQLARQSLETAVSRIEQLLQK